MNKIKGTFFVNLSYTVLLSLIYKNQEHIFKNCAQLIITAIHKSSNLTGFTGTVPDWAMLPRWPGMT